MNTPTALQSLINELNRDIAQDDQSLVADYILITRSEDLNGDETVRTYASANLSHITATGMLHYAQNDIWEGDAEYFGDD